MTLDEINIGLIAFLVGYCVGAGVMIYAAHRNNGRLLK